MAWAKKNMRKDEEERCVKVWISGDYLIIERKQ